MIRLPRPTSPFFSALRSQTRELLFQPKPDRASLMASNDQNPKKIVKSEVDVETKAVIPFVASFNDHIRPLLDAVDRLRQLKVMDEGIQLPTIVVVGDQSSGKSSVLESLADISLPRGQGICTRVPLVMRLQDDVSRDEPELTLGYKGKTVEIRESEITAAICDATDEIAGKSKCIENVPLTLSVKKNGVPDLTMVDLPGITRVPVHGQPENIYEQIHDIIMQYITPKESIILNVLAANVDFPTCESIRLSQKVDKSGERTLAVVTKSDKAPEGLLDKVTADDVNIGLGYVCVRNRVGDESYDEARKEEASLFKFHPLLSNIDKSIVGIPVLAQKLVKIQAYSITRCLPDIVRKINDKLSEGLADLNQMPHTLCTESDAMIAFMDVVGSTKESLRKILVRGEFEEFPDEPEMHCTARLAGMLDKFNKELPRYPQSDALFLMEEISVLKECKGIALPNFLPRSAFLAILKKKINEIAVAPVEFFRRVWTYVEDVVVRVLTRNCDNYRQLQTHIRRAVQNLMEVTREKSLEHLRVLVEMEKVSDYTSNPFYSETCTTLMSGQKRFMDILQEGSSYSKLTLKVFGEVDVGHLWAHLDTAEQAFDMRMRLTAYWRCVVLRLEDGVALHLLYSVKNLVETELEKFVVDEILGSGKVGLTIMLEEAPSTARKRDRLKRRIELLKESQAIVGNIMDRRVTATG